LEGYIGESTAKKQVTLLKIRKADALSSRWSPIWRLFPALQKDEDEIGLKLVLTSLIMNQSPHYLLIIIIILIANITIKWHTVLPLNKPRPRPPDRGPHLFKHCGLMIEFLHWYQSIPANRSPVIRYPLTRWIKVKSGRYIPSIRRK
jgi:hypothetical protein